MNPVFADLPVSVFEVMSRLAREQDAVNLGQGFPDDPGPQDVREKAADAVINGWNQYPPMLGLAELRKAVSIHYKHWQDLDLDPEDVAMGIAEGRMLLVDVREPSETEVERYPEAVYMPMSEFDPSELPDPEGKRVVFACRSGNRSVSASLMAQHAGLPYTAHLAGGIKAWKEAGLPTET